MKLIAAGLDFSLNCTQSWNICDNLKWVRFSNFPYSVSYISVYKGQECDPSQVNYPDQSNQLFPNYSGCANNR